MDELLGKPDKSLLEHSMEVYETGKELASILKIGEMSKRKALLACILHDVGKATSSFQKYIRGETSSSYPHALASLPFILLAENQVFGKSLTATASVISHHSPLTPFLYQGWPAPKYHKKLREFIIALIERVPEFGINPDILLKKAETISDPSQILHNGKLIFKIKDIPREEYAEVKTVLHLADWIASGEETSVSDIFLSGGKSSIANYIKSKGYKLWEFQHHASRMEESLNLRLRAPTGSGKTEALLLWAGNSERIIYLLPTQATVNAMWNRLISVYGEEKVGISHGRARYILRKKWQEQEEDEPPLDYHLFPSVFAKPVVVATLDQFLMGYMNGKHWEEKSVLSKKAAVILDEIHSYEPFTLGILKGILERDKPYKLGVASATLPDVLLDIFGSEKLVEADEFFWQRKRHKLRLLNKKLESGIGRAIDVARKSGKALIISNSIQGAQQIYEIIKNEWPKTILLHSRFTYRDRKKKEEEALSALPGTILVSTQVVEVSLDISYDILLSEICPLDALIQRMGRVNRKGERPPADVVVYNDLSSSSQKVYKDEIIELSRELLESLPEIPTEKELRDATNKLYKEISSGSNFWNELKEGEENLLKLQKELGVFTIDLADEEFRSRFVTRKGMISVDVIPEQFFDEAQRLIDAGERWRLIEITVPIHWYWTRIWADRFFTDSRVKHIIAQLKYDPELGLLPPIDEDDVADRIM